MKIYYKELACVIMEGDIQDLQSASWRLRRAEGLQAQDMQELMFQFKSKCSQAGGNSFLIGGHGVSSFYSDLQQIVWGRTR